MHEECAFAIDVATIGSLFIYIFCSYLIAPPFMAKLMTHESVIIFASNFIIPEMIFIGIHGLMFHSKMRCFHNADLFFYPWIFAKIFFPDMDNLFQYFK